MFSTHLLNIGWHIAAGIAAMAMGGYLLATPKGTAQHRRQGRLFVVLTLMVCASAVIGSIFFRFFPIFAVLTVLVLYQLLSGWHVIYTRAAGPDWLDAALAAGAIAWVLWLLPRVLGTEPLHGGNRVVTYSTLGAIAGLITYDVLRWVFPRRWHATLWRYEHIYKIVASLFAMLSAAVGNLVRFGQPWSQLLPSAVGLVVILWFFRRNYRERPQVTSAA